MKKNNKSSGILTRRKPVSCFEVFVKTLQGEMCCVSWGDNMVTGQIDVQGDALHILSVYNELICVRLAMVESIVQLDEATASLAHTDWLEIVYGDTSAPYTECE